MWWQHPLVYWGVIVWVDLVIMAVLGGGHYVVSKVERVLALRISKFAVVSGSTVPIGMGTLWVGVEVVGLHYMVSNVVAITASTTAWWIFHSLWTFRDRRTDLRAGVVGPLVRLGGVGLYTGLLALFTEVFGLWYIFSAVFAMCIQMPVTYFLSSRLAWIRERGPAPL